MLPLPVTRKIFPVQIQRTHFMEKKILFFLWPQRSQSSTVAQNKIGFWKEASLKYYVKKSWQQDPYHITVLKPENFIWKAS